VINRLNAKTDRIALFPSVSRIGDLSCRRLL
jgi:hypothetical protein